MLTNDWIAVEPEISSGVLKITDGEINVGIVKDLGHGYYADNGQFVGLTGLGIGDKILFTQHLTFEIDGVKVYRTRGRDVIEVLNAKV